MAELYNIDKKSINIPGNISNSLNYYNIVNELSAVKIDGIHPVVHCQTTSDTLIIAAGESWTFGDSLQPYVKAIEEKDNLAYRLSTIFAGRLAFLHKSDLLLIAKPGHYNLGILQELKNRLPEVLKTKKYKNIYSLIQFTSPGRDLHTEYASVYYHPEFKEQLTTKPLRLNDWLQDYELLLFQSYQKILNEIGSKKNIFWKNFTDFFVDYSNLEDDKNRFVASNWSELLFSYSNIKSKFPFTMELQHDYMAHPFFDVTLDELIYNAECYEDYVNNLNLSPLNGYHPTEAGHWLWYNELRKYLDIYIK